MTKTIFMVHGMWGGAWAWDNYRRFFESRGYRCIVTTLPYHDMDPRAVPDPRLGSMSLLDYAAALEQELRALPEKPIVMGHSMGCLLSLILGSRGLASALVLLTPVAAGGIMPIAPSVLRSFWGVRHHCIGRKPMRQTFEEAAYSILHLLPEREQREIYAKFVYESGRAASEIGFWPFDIRGAARVDESKITCPLLIVGAGKDRITPVSISRALVKKFESVATYKEFPDHAHWVLGEPGWQDVAEYAHAWFASPAREA